MRCATAYGSRAMDVLVSDCLLCGKTPLTITALVGGLLAYAISHIGGPVAAWRWLFVIFGLVTFVWGIVLLSFLPDAPSTARFLPAADKEYAAQRSQQHTRSFKTTTWRKEQFLEAIKDPKTWFLFVYTVCSTIPNGGLTNVSALPVHAVAKLTQQ